MRAFIKRITFPLIKPLVFRWLRKPRPFKYRGLQLTVLPGVFHPGLFFSTKFLLGFLETLDLKGQRLLELGAGSGAVGFYAEQLGANATLSDISDKAIEGLELNKAELSSHAEIIKSDLFDGIEESFDFIIVNPPYYPKQPKNQEEMAWFCGEDFEYFGRFFKGLASHLKANGQCYMVLSEDCEITRIKTMAKQEGYSMNLEIKKRIAWEWNYIFEITKGS